MDNLFREIHCLFMEIQTSDNPENYREELKEIRDSLEEISNNITRDESK